MSSKRQQRRRRRAERGAAAGRSLLRRSRAVGGIRLGMPVVILLALAFVLWLILDVAGARL